ncbi:MAG: 2-hydroxymuconic semialdehyde dehydrogenase [Euryarchaeota archaeon]|nr:2-hydroxymuconic semialdehyde dehydrogenase [Euryarchaeota archaeon]
MQLMNYINGNFCPQTSGKWITNLNPATGEEICKVPISNSKDVKEAINSAKNAYPNWSKYTPHERAIWLDKIADKLEEMFEEIAQLESMDTGKPISLSRNVDANRSVANFRFFSELIRGMEIEEFEMKDATNYVIQKPNGIGALITPWNLPLYLLSWKVAPAIGMGNTVVCKPSELTPMTADLLMRAVDEIGLPAGVINLVHGNGIETGSLLVEDSDIDFVSFTGGTVTGSKVASSAASTFKKLSLELGGKNSSIVFADCDFEKTIAGVVRSGFLNQGQICLCGSRIFIEEEIYEDFKNRLINAVEEMKIGDPLDEETDLGALISKEHLSKIEYYANLAIEEGGTLLTGGVPCLPKAFENGNWMAPIIVEGLSPESRCSKEEIFGPMVTLHIFKEESELIKMVNNTRYGLAGSIWTKDLDKGRRLSESIETGMIWINTWLHRDLRVPFGGVKDSGVGREGGKWSLGFFSEAMNVCVKHE